MVAILKLAIFSNDLCRKTIAKYKNNAFVNVMYIAGICKARKGTRKRGYPGPFHKLICGIGGE